MRACMFEDVCACRCMCGCTDVYMCRCVWRCTYIEILSVPMCVQMCVFAESVYADIYTDVCFQTCVYWCVSMQVCVSMQMHIVPANLCVCRVFGCRCICAYSDICVCVCVCTGMCAENVMAPVRRSEESSSTLSFTAWFSGTNSSKRSTH